MSMRWVCAVLLVGCGSTMVPVSDAGRPDAGAVDAGTSAGGMAGGASGGSAGGSAGGASGGMAGGAAGAAVSVMDAGVTALAGGDTCDLAPDVTAGGRFTGTTNGFTDDYSVSGAGCPTGGAASGRDVAYRLSPPVAGMYTVRVTPVPATLADGGSNRFDPMLVVQRACGQLGCVIGTILNGPGDPESVTFAVGAGETMFIVVDGELGSRGEFELEVRFP
jgi:hypothetical protein